MTSMIVSELSPPSVCHRYALYGQSRSPAITHLNLLPPLAPRTVPQASPRRTSRRPKRRLQVRLFGVAGVRVVVVVAVVSGGGSIGTDRFGFVRWSDETKAMSCFSDVHLGSGCLSDRSMCLLERAHARAPRVEAQRCTPTLSGGGDATSTQAAAGPDLEHTTDQDQTAGTAVGQTGSIWTDLARPVTCVAGNSCASIVYIVRQKPLAPCSRPSARDHSPQP